MRTLEEIRQALAGYNGRPLKIMEVCGTHTSAIIKGGIREMLSPKIRLVSGPGCPVCVTSPYYMDEACAYALKPDHVLVTFSDMMKVPGLKGNLYDARASGGRIEMVYSPLTILDRAAKNPDTTYVMAAVGFETTAPVYAILLDEAEKRGIGNIRLLTAIKTILPAMESILESEEIDGFICPGHVSAIIGARAYEPLAARFDKPFVIAGFDAENLLAAIYEIVRWAKAEAGEVKNLYTSIVSPDGNGKAKLLLDKYFMPCDCYWRGLGAIPASGLKLRPEYERFDVKWTDKEAAEAASQNTMGCRCGDVIKGRINPDQCPLFGGVCTPQNPFGACMVSQEGACGVWFSNMIRKKGGGYEN